MKYARPIFIVCLFGIAFMRYQHKPHDDVVLANYSDQVVHLKARLLDDPNEDDVKQKVLIEVLELNNHEHPVTNILTTIKSHDQFKYGDDVEIEGRLHKPEVIVSDDGSEFDYPMYLAKDDIFYLLDAKKVIVLSHNNGNIFKEKLLELRRNFLKNITEALPSPYSFLAGGLVIAGKGSLDKKLQEEFKRVGLIHVVVLSGSNVTIIGQTIVSIFSFLPPLLKNLFGAFGIICFAVMAGTSATIVRSVIMSLIGLYAQVSGHRYSALQGLSLAALLMFAHNPYILFFDSSFQLSFTATLGLILLGKRVEQYLMWITPRFGFREIVSSSLATQIFVTPLILHLTGMFSFVSLLVNIIVVPLIPFTMLFVFFTGVSSFISSYIVVPFSFVSYLLLKLELTVVHIFSQFNFAARTFSKPGWKPTLLTYTLYSLYFLTSWKVSERKKRKDKKYENFINTKGLPP